jgi:hypothetical protein
MNVIWRRPKRWLVVACAILLLGGALLWTMHVMRLVREVSPAEFWLCVAGTDIDGVKPQRPYAVPCYQPRDGWFVYYRQNFHGQALYRIRANEASAVFPKVAEQLRRAPPCSVNRDVEMGFRDWERSGGAADDAVGFLAHVRNARLARLKQLNLRLHDEIQSEGDFAERWERVNRYHWNGWFEFLYLGFLIVFAA